MPSNMTEIAQEFESANRFIRITGAQQGWRDADRFLPEGLFGMFHRCHGVSDVE